MEPRRQRLSQRRKAAELSASLPGQSQAGQDWAESANLFRPQSGEAAATLAGDTALPVGGCGQVAAIKQIGPAELAHPNHPSHARSRRVKRFAVLGALAVVIGGAASAQLATSGGALRPEVEAGIIAPVAVIPASELGPTASLPDHSAPVAATIRDAEGTAPPAPAAAPALPAAAPQPRATRTDNRTVPPRRSTQDATTVAPPRDDRATAAESYVWSRAAELGAHDQRWERLTSPRP